MKKPSRPPVNAVGLLLALKSACVGQIFTEAVRSEADGKYQHWDILRHLTPPEGASHEQWWGATKVVRQAGLKDLALHDTANRPFRYGTRDVLVERLHKIDLGAGGLIGMPEPVTNPRLRDQYVMRSLFQEAVSSSQLEGAATTRAVAKEMIRSGRPPRTRGERMILNNFRTMQGIAAWRQRALDPALIFEMHRMVTEGTLDNEDAAGRLRQPDEPVSVQDEITGEVLHEPPPAEELPERLAKLCAFANEIAVTEGRTTNRFHASSRTGHPVAFLVGL